MRGLLLFSFPALILCLAILIPILLNWSQGVPLCDTWLNAVLPACR